MMLMTREKKRLKLTQKANLYWKGRASSDDSEMNKLYDKCEDGELVTFLGVLNKVQSNIENMKGSD